LNIWNIKMGEKSANNPLYHLICSRLAFNPEVQEVIHSRLFKPISVKPESGDLIILDVARPHAVAGFRKGLRIALQSFIRHGPSGELRLSS